MSLESLQKNIEHEAKSSVSSIEGDAKEQAKKIISEAESKAKEIKKKYDEETEIEVKRLETEYKSSADIATNNMVFIAREEVVQEAMPKIKKMSVSKLKPKEETIIKEAIKEACEIGPVEELVVETNKESATAARKTGAEVKVTDIDLGAVIYTSDKKVKIDATFDTLFNSKTEEIRSFVETSIFPKKRESMPKKVKESKKPVKKNVKKEKKSAKKKKGK